MRVGDYVIYVGDRQLSCYTKNKHYEIYKIDKTFIPGCTCAYIKDDEGYNVYFKNTDSNDKDWIFVNTRKEKLEKLNENR